MIPGIWKFGLFARLQSAVQDHGSKDRRIAWKLALWLPVAFVILGICTSVPFSYSPMTSIAKLTFFAALFACVWTDSLWHRIPNWVTYPAFAWAIILSAIGSIIAENAVTDSATGALATVVGPAWIGGIGFLSCILGALACFGLTVFASAWIKIAGGDVKLAIVIGAFLGVHNGVLAICFGCLFAGLMAVLICLHHLGTMRIVLWSLAWLRNRILPWRFSAPPPIDDPILQSSLPLAGPLTLGVMLALIPIPGLTI